MCFLADVFRGIFDLWNKKNAHFSSPMKLVFRHTLFIYIGSEQSFFATSKVTFTAKRYFCRKYNSSEVLHQNNSAMERLAGFDYDLGTNIFQRL